METSPQRNGQERLFLCSPGQSGLRGRTVRRTVLGLSGSPSRTVRWHAADGQQKLLWNLTTSADCPRFATDRPQVTFRKTHRIDKVLDTPRRWTADCPRSRPGLSAGQNLKPTQTQTSSGHGSKKVLRTVRGLGADCPPVKNEKPHDETRVLECSIPTPGLSANRGADCPRTLENTE
jgi:hypothetical protein